MNWRFEHLRHVTSSNCATICRVTERIDMAALAKSLVTQHNSEQAVAVKYFMPTSPCVLCLQDVF